jgi:hypothetical protein
LRVLVYLWKTEHRPENLKYHIHLVYFVYRSTAARLLRSWVRIPSGPWMFVCCVLSGRGLCDELITRPEESYWLWRVVVCDQETSWNEEAIARAGLQSQRKKILRVLVWLLVTEHMLHQLKGSFLKTTERRIIRKTSVRNGRRVDERGSRGNIEVYLNVTHKYS